MPFLKNDEFINNSVPFLKNSVPFIKDSVPKILYRTQCQICNKIRIKRKAVNTFCRFDQVCLKCPRERFLAIISGTVPDRLDFCRQLRMAIRHFISKGQAQEGSGRLSNFNMVEYCDVL